MSTTKPFRNWIGLVVIIIVALVLFALYRRTSSVDTLLEDPTPCCPSPPPPPPPQSSTVILAGTFDVPTLLRPLGGRLPWVIKYSQGKTHAVVHRRKPLTVEADAQSQTLRLSTQVVCRAAHNLAPAPSPRVGFDKKTEPDKRPSFEVTAVERIRVTHQYDLEVTHDHCDLQAINPAVVGGGILGDLDVTPALTGLIIPKLDQELRSGTQELSTQTQRVIRPFVERFWRQLNADHQLDDDLVLQFNPQQIDVTPITFEADNKVSFACAIHFLPRAFLGKAPKSEIRELPPARIVESLGSEGSFQFHIPLLLEPGAIAKRMNKAGSAPLRLTIPNLGARHLSIQNVDLFPDGAQAVMQITYTSKETGDRKGRLILRGTPTYDSKSNVISFADLDFEATTTSVIDASVLSIFKKQIRDWLRGYVSIRLADAEVALLKKGREALTAALKDSPLSVRDESVSLRYLGWEGTGKNRRIALMFSAGGKIGVIAEKLEPVIPGRGERTVKSVKVHFDIFEDDKEEDGGLYVVARKESGGPEIVFTSGSPNLGDWGYNPQRETWKDFTPHETPFVAFPGPAPALVGEYSVSFRLRDDESRIDIESEMYAEVIDSEGERYISPLSYKYWRNNEKVHRFVFRIE